MKFASSLRRDLIEMAGEKIGDHARPSHARSGWPISAWPNSMPNVISRSKARYLIDAAAAVARGELALEGLARARPLRRKTNSPPSAASAPGRRVM